MEFDGKDLGYVEDAFHCSADLYNAETHALATYTQTKDEDWLELAEMCRKDRSVLLYSLAPLNVGESYCFMKHISGVARNLQELGNRKLEAGDKEYAKELFEKSETYKRVFLLIHEEKGKKGGKNVKSV